jgi:hypothetical protein
MKKYIAPEMEIFNMQIESTLLAGSVTLTPNPWEGTGDAGSRMFEDDGIDILMGEDFDKLFGI